MSFPYPITARQKRNDLARGIVSRFTTLLTELKDLEDDIRQLWVEFDHLPKGEKILGCSTKKEFCEKKLGRSDRAVRYMLDGGNHKREKQAETVSAPQPFDDDEVDDDEETPTQDPFKSFQFPGGKEREAAAAARAAEAVDRKQDDAHIREFARSLIKEGRRALAMKHHPDKGGTGNDMIAVNEAEKRLSQFVEHNWDDTFSLLSKFRRGGGAA
jgi:hypothetical protein